MDYEKILEGVVNIINTTEKSDIGFANICTYIGENCPELAESEDEKIRKKVIDVLKLNVRGAESQMQASRSIDREFEVQACNKVIAWLERQGEQKHAWSEEDDRIMNDTLAVVERFAGRNRKISVEVSNWLKLLKSRVCSLSIREFDKEEGSIIDHLIAICDDAMCYDTFAGCSKKDIEKYKSFLTNLKFGINPQPQTTWKPSDEEIKVLDAAVMHSHLTTAEYDGLVKLIEQLKKLREE